MQRTELASLYKATPADGTKVTVCGWAKTVRDSKNIGFISLSDGSCYKPVQIVFQADKLANYAEIAKCGLYTSFEVTGSVVVTPGAKQPFEINADEITVLGPCGGDYPLQKKKMGMDYLRTMTHLRPRTNTFNAAFRVRGQAAFALHQFFHEHGFTYVHTPIFTGSDCEGAGEMFQVTTLDLNDIPRNDEGGVDYTKDFFKRPVNLTVSGQLEAEAMAMALGNVYTFGPTFRAEKSYDTRHAAEFWMIEPEMAFADLNTYLETAEAMTRYVIRYLLDNCPDELAFFNQFFDKGLIERLELVASSDFARVTYTDAIELLKKNNDNFQYKVEWGTDLQTEHERYLTEQIFKKPVFVTDYPKEIKAFYMRQNEDGKTVAAADMLVPGIGELIGGSQREERLDVLEARMKELGLNTADYDWYLDLRRYGSVKHAGYGLGFERLLMYVTGIPNIRDVIPFPRTCGGFCCSPWPHRCCNGLTQTRGSCLFGRSLLRTISGSARSCSNRPVWQRPSPIMNALSRLCRTPPRWRPVSRTPCASCGRGWATTTASTICRRLPASSASSTAATCPPTTTPCAVCRASVTTRRARWPALRLASPSPRWTATSCAFLRGCTTTTPTSWPRQRRKPLLCGCWTRCPRPRPVPTTRP